MKGSIDNGDTDSKLTFAQLDVIYQQVLEMRRKAKISEGVENFLSKFYSLNNACSSVLSKIRRAYINAHNDYDVTSDYIVQIQFTDGKVYQISISAWRTKYVYEQYSSKYNVIANSIYHVNSNTSSKWSPNSKTIPSFMTDDEYQVVRWLQGPDKKWARFKFLVELCSIEK